MGNINYARVLLGALIAGVVYFVCDGVIHGAILSREHEAAIIGAGKQIVQDPSAYGYFALFDFGKGLLAMLFYAAARARLGPGPVTAAWAGVVAWLGVEALPAIGAMPFPFYSKFFYVKVMALEIVPMILGAIAGAWPYKEDPASSTTR